ncbi:hypothetical protein JK2ML_1002 [Mycobacterium leprae Kyoto-2]|uniref:Possible conserved membrane protein n=3 Tax=Mycobacterium leprae TaxID=1769 RepID=Q7AQB6_MYCLE|nr:u2235i [Mycobacterium leprae]OAR21457.1 hypothetical protein A8144_06005 [Mycobacterium leprae 3125609]OAX71284.1 hypothetical protein A3216_06665 [Mycobacterium leprae 7935681]CAR71097.1 possible conserved membrane protein [Mycobacterium leprae Br4923]BBC16904.1 hypothetical protein JK2ML_1002 [Mycobacterium leprae Kyoto-2]
MSKRVRRALANTATTAVVTVLLAPVVTASPTGDADDAITAAWHKAGGDNSVLGAKKGEVYPLGDGFAQNFASGKLFFTTATGAKLLYGPVLGKYESLGGPVNSDLGFPIIDEVPGLAGPDSRVSIFAASDNPVIFWTPDHGAFVVRGALNAAWDKLGSSAGVLGVPVADESFDGEVISQKFSGGAVFWNKKSSEFTTEPTALAEQLTGLLVATDPTTAISMAWRAAGGVSGPLGPKQGGQHPIGADGIIQDFAGGKVFFSKATGANAVENDILAKYESLGGPVGSDLGFPAANEGDGGIVTSSRIAIFSAADKPVIFWTPDHGAFVVRGAMKAAWDKLKGPNGKLGVPVADQSVDGNVISQRFIGGKISWNRANNTFTADPANLASLLSGLQVSEQSQPSELAMLFHAKKSTGHWWWLVAAVAVLLVIVMFVLLALGWRRRRTAHDIVADSHDHDMDVGMDFGYKAAVDGQCTYDAESGTEHPVRDVERGPTVSWLRGAQDATGLAQDARLGPAFGSELPSESEEPLGLEEDDPDAVDTDSMPALSDADFPYAALSDAAHWDADAAEVVATDNSSVATDNSSLLETAADTEVSTGRHAAVDMADAMDASFPGVTVPRMLFRPSPTLRPTIHLPLDDPYQVPDGYPIKASPRFGLYYTPASELYHDTLAEVWLANEEIAQVNGFIKAD